MVERKKSDQFSFADALVTVRASSNRLGKLCSVVKWYRFEKVLKPLASESETGRAADAVQGPGSCSGSTAFPTWNWRRRFTTVCHSAASADLA